MLIPHFNVPTDCVEGVLIVLPKTSTIGHEDLLLGIRPGLVFHLVVYNFVERGPDQLKHLFARVCKLLQTIIIIVLIDFEYISGKDVLRVRKTNEALEGVLSVFESLRDRVVDALAAIGGLDKAAADCCTFELYDVQVSAVFLFSFEEMVVGAQ